MGLLVKILIPVGLLAAALITADVLIKTRVEAPKQKTQQKAKLVHVITTERMDVQAVVHAMGTVIPAQEVTLMPQVSGQVASMSPHANAGSLVDAGTNLLEIDTRDYEFAIQQCCHAVVQAELNLRLEQGNQAVARAEYEMLKEQVSQQDRDLVLRELHLKQALSALESSKAALAQAELNRDRCCILAPFNGVIRRKHVELGATVSPSTELLDLIGTDEYWIEVVARTDQLDLIQMPNGNFEHGAAVRIFDKSQWGANTHRQGHLIRQLPELETSGRMARLLVSVQDPLSLGADDMPALLIGSYVHVEIMGKTITSVIPLAREYLRNGNIVWVMNQDNCLEIRPVQIAYRDKSKVYINHGIEPTDHIVTTNIEAPIHNMPLSLELSPNDSMTDPEHQSEKQL
jgi:RND family efflux transporter MFP subunit